jgi:hypothetical protein
MFELDYKISDNPNDPGIDLKSADDSDFNYNLFMGDIVLKMGNVDFSTAWGWIPLLDFVTYLHKLLEQFKEGSKDTFEFTESEATLDFQRVGEKVQIKASYADGTIEVDYEELKSKAGDILKKLGKDLLYRYPELQHNSVFTRLVV